MHVQSARCSVAGIAKILPEVGVADHFTLSVRKPGTSPGILESLCTPERVIRHYPLLMSIIEEAQIP